MNFIKKIERYHKIDQLIQQECTGTPKEFAEKLGINRSHLYRLLNIMKDYGAYIEYSRKYQTFYYSKTFKIKNILPNKTLSTHQMEKLNGGKIDCGEGFGLTVGGAVSLAIIAGATGGVGLAVLAIGVFWGGGLAAGSNCGF